MVCSAHPFVIEAALEHGRAGDQVVLIEATSNQVDQFGGYTGMRPSDFRAFVERIGHRIGFPVERIVLGGDHLGPNRWRNQPAATAMSHVDELVRSYVAAGYTKLHLDCSYPCADDNGALSDEIVAARAVRMLTVAESEAARVGVSGRLRYVIGTEVPAPGGAAHRIDDVRPTTAESARATLAAHRRAFNRAGLERVWPQVMALVVQPGLEFDHLRVVDYRAGTAGELRTVLDEEPAMTFEAHSTDYQTRTAFEALVADGWRVLKVGPGLTFAMREALFALAAIENELVAPRDRSQLPEVVERRMLAAPEHWERYCPGSAAERYIARRYSYSDRAVLLAGSADRRRGAAIAPQSGQQSDPGADARRVRARPVRPCSCRTCRFCRPEKPCAGSDQGCAAELCAGLRDTVRRAGWRRDTRLTAATH